MVEARLCWVMCTTAEDAERIGRAVIEERLAAAANILPAGRSLFRWKDEIESAPEVALVLKTTARCSAALARRLADLHPYEVPAVTVLPVVDASPSYLAWLDENTCGEPLP